MKYQTKAQGNRRDDINDAQGNRESSERLSAPRSGA